METEALTPTKVPGADGSSSQVARRLNWSLEAMDMAGAGLAASTHAVAATCGTSSMLPAQPHARRDQHPQHQHHQQHHLQHFFPSHDAVINPYLPTNYGDGSHYPDGPRFSFWPQQMGTMTAYPGQYYDDNGPFTFTIVDGDKRCRVSCMLTDENETVERAIAIAVQRPVGTFGLRDAHGVFAISAYLLRQRGGGPFTVVPLPSTPARVSQTSQSTQESQSAGFVHLSPQMMQQLGLDPNTLAAPLSLPKELSKNDASSEDLASPKAAPKQSSSRRARKASEEDTLIALQEEGQLSLSQVRHIVTAVDDRLSFLGLRSQKEKALFLSELGFKISQQHYSSTLQSARDLKWLGGLKASASVRRMQQLILDVEEERQAELKDMARRLRYRIKHSRTSRNSQSSLELTCENRRLSGDSGAPDADAASPGDASRSDSPEQPGADQQPKPKSTSVTRIPQEIRDDMIQLFDEGTTRPSRDLREAFAHRANVSLRRINVFFQNLRARRKTPPGISVEQGEDSQQNERLESFERLE